MAIFHMSVKVIQRSKGRSAVAAAAYRASEKILDERTGLEHDYTRKGKPIGTPVIITPDGSKISRAELWNMAEQAEKRKDATTAREYELALPCELTTEQRESLAKEFCHYLAQKNGCAVDMAIHKPSGKDGDERNFHAHILTTTRIFENGTLGRKCDLELSDRDRKAKGLDGRKNELLATREAWANFVNRALEKAGHEIRVDHRTLEAQGVDRLPTKHLGPTATAIVREERHKKKGRHSDRADEQRGLIDTGRKIAEQEKDLAAIQSEIESLKAEIAFEAERAAENSHDDYLAKLDAFEKNGNFGEGWKQPYIDFIAQNGATPENYAFGLKCAKYDASESGQRDLEDKYFQFLGTAENSGMTERNKTILMNHVINSYRVHPDRFRFNQKAVNEVGEGMSLTITRFRELERDRGLGR